MATKSSDECGTCFGVDASCEECGSPMPPDAEVYDFAGPGECVGCHRKVMNTWRKRGKKNQVCWPCIHRALAQIQVPR